MDVVLGELPQLIISLALIIGAIVLLVLKIMIPNDPIITIIFTGILGYWLTTGTIKLNSKIKQAAATGSPEPPVVVETTPHILTRDTTV